MKHFTKTSQRRNILIVFLFIVAFFLIFRLGILAGTQKGIVNIQNDTLNVRSGPGKSYQVVSILETYDIVTILDIQYDTEGNAWYQVYLEKGTEIIQGYAHSYYIDLLPDGTLDDKEFEIEMVKQNFPESYKPYLRALHKQYPTWKFTAFHTNLKWDEVIEAEGELSRNLVPNSSSKSSWKSTKEGAFDWKKNVWVILSGSNSVQASDDVIRYYMDPRNFLNDSSIFQFELLTYDSSSQIKAGVEAILKGTFMADASVEAGLTYADAFMQLGKELGISPYFLASRVRQEQGVSGTSKLISGTEAGFEGYYNYFNIGASGSSTAEVVKNGLTKAKSEGWNTRYKSLRGGALFAAQNYILKGQDTLYLQKFDVDSQYSGLYWHQYMQTIHAPQNEGISVRRAYSEMGLLESSFTFKIPVYLNMPSTACAAPTGDGNPNYKLSSIAINGYSLTPNFDMDTINYSLIVPYSVSKINITAAAYASTTTIKGTGEVALKVGSNTIEIVATAENGDSRTYFLTVTRENDPAPTTEVYSDTLRFDGSFVYGFEVGLSGEQALHSLQVKNGTASLLAANGEQKTGPIATGDILRICDTAGVVKMEYTVIIFGDLTGDGLVDTLDLVYMKRHIWDISYLSGTFMFAADVTHDGEIDTLDLVYIKRHVWNIQEIVQQ